MPVYFYECGRCETIKEEYRPMKDVNNVCFCPACGGLMQNIIAPSTFHLKGGNWAKDGYSGKASSSD